MVHLDGTVSGKSGPPKTDHSPRWHGRIPAEILLNPSVSAEAVRVYGILALFVFEGNSSYVGTRRLGDLAGFSHQTAMRKLDELVKAGHVTISKAGKGKRSSYVLTSQVFGQKQRSGQNVVTQNPHTGRKRLVSVKIA